MTKRILPFIFLAILPAFFVFILFFGGRIFSSDDVLLQFYPYAVSFHNALRKGIFLLMEGGMLAGFPLGVTMNGGFFHPLHVIVFWFFDGFSGYHFLTLFWWAGGGLAMYGFLRRLRLDSPAAMLGTAVYIASQSVFSWLPILPQLHAIWLLPALFFLTHRLAERFQWRDWIVIMAVLAGGWLAASPQLAVWSAVAAGCFAIYLDARRPRAFSNPSGLRMLMRRFPAAFQYGSAGFASLLITAPYLLFAQVFNDLSSRPSLSFAEYHGTALDPGALLRYLIPSVHVPYVVPAEAVAIGFVPLVFALVAIGRLRKEYSAVTFFASMTGVAILAAVKYSPVTILLHYIPVFKYFRGPARLVFFAAFGLAVLAAYGFTQIAKREGESDFSLLKKALWAWTGLAAVSGIIALIALYAREYILSRLMAYFDAHLYAKTSGLPLDHYHAVIGRYLDEALSAISLVSPDFLLVLGSTIFGLIFCITLLRRGHVNAAGLALTGLILVEGTGLFFFTKPFVDRGVLDEPSVVSAIRLHDTGNSVPPRIFSLRPLEEQYRRLVVPHAEDRKSHSAFLLAMLTPNTGLFWNMPTIDGYDNLMPRDLAEVLVAAGSERATVNWMGREDGERDSEQAVLSKRLSLLGRMGVRYIVSAHPIEHPSLSLVAQNPVTQYQIPILLYENATARPLVEFAENPVRFPGGSAADWIWGRNAADAVGIDCGTCDFAHAGATEGEVVLVEMWQSDQVRLQTVTNNARWVIVRNMYLPGWRAEIDGKQVPIMRADGIFQALEIPPGSHEVVFRFFYNEAIGSLLSQ